MKYEQVITFVKEAGNIARDKNLLSDYACKTDSDFVTAVDLNISEFLKKKLAAFTPDIGFMSEEEEAKIEPVRWILDPIDGTTNLLYDYHMSSISLGLCDHEKIVFGVVYNPFTDELFYAERGKGAYYNGTRLSKAPDRDLKNSIVEFGAGVSRKDHIEEAFNIAKEVFANCLDIRRVCSSALVLCYIAAGKLNGYFERSLKPWDYAAASLILEECGGISVTWDGDKIQFERPSTYIAGTEKVVSYLLETVQKYRDS